MYGTQNRASANGYGGKSINLASGARSAKTFRHFTGTDVRYSCDRVPHSTSKVGEFLRNDGKSSGVLSC